MSVGFVVDIRTENGRTYITLALDYRELATSALRMGQLVRVHRGEYYGTKSNYLGMVTNCFYRPITYSAHAEALALKNLNKDQAQGGLDEHTAKNINFLHYEIVVLGGYTSGDPHSGPSPITFYPSTRFVPSLLDTSVFTLTNEELQALINVSLQPTNCGQQPHRTAIGYLRVGSDEEGKFREVKKYVNVDDFHGRRTANFGKTGFGKSNENKVVLLLLKYYFSEAGMLIFDLNGEYASQTVSGTAMGLIEAFEKLKIRDQIVWFTNREGISGNEFYKVRPMKINFYTDPYLALELAYQRELHQTGRVPQYLEAARAGLHPENGDWKTIRNKMAYVYGALLKAGLKPRAGYRVQYNKETYVYTPQKNDFCSTEDSLTQKLAGGAQQNQSKMGSAEEGSGARELFTYAKRLSFLGGLHTDKEVENFIEQSVREAIGGKVVILDLPTLRPEQVEFISSRVAARLFDEALQRYTLGAGKDSGQQKTDVLVVIEEAHNLLAQPSNVFYRIAREGRKYGIGMLYSTQTPSGIPMEILAQTENFLVKHVSSEEDVKALKKAKVAFAEPISDFILNEPVVGLSYVYMEPYQPFPVPVQVKLLEEVVEELPPK